MDVSEALIYQLPEAIYFALFIILSKRLKTNRILFIVISTIEYLALMNILPFSIWVHVLYFVSFYALLKILYGEKAQITDLFTLGIASLSVMAVSIFWYTIISLTIKNIIVCNILAKLTLFILLFLFRNKLGKIQDLYKKLWNRNDKVKKIMKSATFRCINLVLFNIMFYVINFYIIIYFVWR